MQRTDTPNWTLGSDFTKFIVKVLETLADTYIKGDMEGYIRQLIELFDNTAFSFRKEIEEKEWKELQDIRNDIYHSEEKRNAMGQVVEVIYPKRNKLIWDRMGSKKRLYLRNFYDSGFLIPKKNVYRDEDDDDDEWNDDSPTWQDFDREEMERKKKEQIEDDEVL